MKKNNNKGYSLMELIVVIAIIAIMTVGAGVALFSWRSWNINDCAKKIDTALASAKVDAMSKESSLMTVKKGSDGIYILSLNGEEEHLGDSQVTISYTAYYTGDSGGRVQVTKEIKGAEELHITYDRATGSFNEIGTESGNPLYCESINIVRGDRHKTITLVQKTGKHFLQ